MEKTVFLKFAGHATRYGIVGIIGTILHIGTLALLVEQFSVDPVLSSVMGFLLALIVSYLLNFFWVFNTRRKHRVAGLRYAVVSISGLILSTLIMYIVVDILQWWYGWGALGIILVVPASNFLLNYLWTFGAHETSA
jgi:putative flippase GtrA